MIFRIAKYWGAQPYDGPLGPKIGGARAPRAPWSRRLWSLNKKASGAQCFIMALGLFWDIVTGLP